MSDIKTAVEALNPYVLHHKDCAVLEGLGWGYCTCGLDAALAALRALPESVPTPDPTVLVEALERIASDGDTSTAQYVARAALRQYKEGSRG